MKAFSFIFPPEFWTLLKVFYKVFYLLLNYYRQNLNNSQRKATIKATNIRELFQFYGINIINFNLLEIILYIENTDGNNTRNIRLHFNQIVGIYNNIPKLDMRKFQTFRITFNSFLKKLQVF
jgi:hypothetical protein